AVVEPTGGVRGDVFAMAGGTAGGGGVEVVQHVVKEGVAQAEDGVDGLDPVLAIDELGVADYVAAVAVEDDGVGGVGDAQVLQDGVGAGRGRLDIEGGVVIIGNRVAGDG